MDKKKYEVNKNLAIQYTTALVLPTDTQWMKIPCTTKLSMLQITPDKVIKTRKIGYQVIPYVSIDYIERALNFVSNFEWGIKIVDKGLKQYTKKNKKGQDKEIYDAWVQCDCYIVLDGNRIDRSVFGSRQMYENPAISSFAVYEAARSMATKSFADTLGIGSDKMRAENEAIEKAREGMLEKSYTDEDLLSDMKQPGEKQ